MNHAAKAEWYLEQYLATSKELAKVFGISAGALVNRARRLGLTDPADRLRLTGAGLLDYVTEMDPDTAPVSCLVLWTHQGASKLTQTALNPAAMQVRVDAMYHVAMQANVDAVFHADPEKCF